MLTSKLKDMAAERGLSKEAKDGTGGSKEKEREGDLVGSLFLLITNKNKAANLYCSFPFPSVHSLSLYQSASHWAARLFLKKSDIVDQG